MKATTIITFLFLTISSIIILSACHDNPVHFLNANPMKTRVSVSAAPNVAPKVKAKELDLPAIPLDPIQVAEVHIDNMKMLVADDKSPIEMEEEMYGAPRMVASENAAEESMPRDNSCVSSPKEDCIAKKGNKRFADTDFNIYEPLVTSGFQNEVTKGNVLCKLPCEKDSAENYLYDYDEYLSAR